MIDIVVLDSGVSKFDTEVQKATNILSIQLGALEYAPDFGVDLDYFLNGEFRLQNESFKSYLIQRLSSYGVNVSTLVDLVESLSHQYTFNLTAPESSTGMIAR